MANSATGAVWNLNTAPFSYAYPVKVDNLNITDSTAADHVVIKDFAGRTLVDWTADAGTLEYRIGKLGWVNGIVIASGGLGTSSIVTIAVGVGK